MKGLYLGACLDHCRWGSIGSVMYEVGVGGLVDFIRCWMQQNPDTGNLWHHSDPPHDLMLPHIHHDRCPRDSKKHNGTIPDRTGRIRCSSVSSLKFRPDFVYHTPYFDEHSDMVRRRYLEDTPREPPEFAWTSDGRLYPDFKLKYDEETLLRFRNQKPSFQVEDPCYAIISDMDSVLSLETVINRLDILPAYVRVYCNRPGECGRLDELSPEEREDALLTCPGHVQPHDKTEFRFDGWHLAHYVRKWFEQGSARSLLDPASHRTCPGL